MFDILRFIFLMTLARNWKLFATFLKLAHLKPLKWGWFNIDTVLNLVSSRTQVRDMTNLLVLKLNEKNPKRLLQQEIRYPCHGP